MVMTLRSRGYTTVFQLCAHVVNGITALRRVSKGESCVTLMLYGVKHGQPSSYLHAVTGMGVLAAGQIANRSLAQCYITK